MSSRHSPKSSSVFSQISLQSAKKPEKLTGVLLGFDFGLRHIGVAVGQTVTQSANPLTSLKAKNGVPDWSEVTDLINTWQPVALVVGIPLNMDGTQQPLTKKAQRFANQLHQHTKLEVYCVDERLTTVEAKAALFAQGGFGKLSKENVDQYSAKLILEAFFSD